MKPKCDVPEFANGDVVYLVVGGEHSGMIIGTLYALDGSVRYQVSWDSIEDSFHFAAELTKTKALNS